MKITISTTPRLQLCFSEVMENAIIGCGTDHQTEAVIEISPEEAGGLIDALQKYLDAKQRK